MILLLSVVNLPPVGLLVVIWIDRSYLCHAAGVHVISCDNIHYDIMDGMPLATNACNQYTIKAVAKKCHIHEYNMHQEHFCQFDPGGNNYLFSAPWYMWQCYKSSNGGIMICLQGNHSGVMRVLRHFKTWATQLLVQKFVPVHNEQIIKVLHYQTFVWGTHWWLWFHSHKVLIVWQLFPCNGITMKWELGIWVIYSCLLWVHFLKYIYLCW